MSWCVSIISNVCIHSSDDMAAEAVVTRNESEKRRRRSRRKRIDGQGFCVSAPPDGSTVVKFIDSRAGPHERVYSQLCARVSLCTW